MKEIPRRYELKAVIASQNTPYVETLILCHPNAFHKRYVDRIVNNVYFDTDDLETLNDNLNGTSRRCKLRLRWYVPKDSGYPCDQFVKIGKEAKIELKNKQDGTGWKKSFPLGEKFDLRTGSWDSLLKSIQKSLPHELNNLFYGFKRPVLINQYRRRYYEDFEQKCRITIDSNIYCFNQLVSARPNVSFFEPRQDYCIVEFKSLEKHQKELMEVIQSFPFLIQKHSKYVSWTDNNVMFMI